MTGVGTLTLPLRGPGSPISTLPTEISQEVQTPAPTTSEDSFQETLIPQSAIGEPEVERPGFFRSMIRGVVNFGRRAWKAIRKYNPITQVLNLIEGIRTRPHVRQAASRNGATTNEEVQQYHESLIYNEQNPHDNKIFRAYLGNGNTPRPTIILFLGNSQNFNLPENEAGVLRLADRLRRDRDVDLLVFRVGSASNELRHRFCIGGDPSLHTSVVYQHSVNVIEDYINGRGMFAGRRPPSRVIFGGYSFGGGTIDRLLREDWQRIGRNIPVTGSVYIDGVTLGSYDLGDGVEQRPPHSAQHLNFYQQNSSVISGNHLRGTRPNDVSVPVPSTIHSNIDDNEEVQNRAYRFIRNAVIRN